MNSLDKMRRAAAILGGIPAGSLGTQEPVYRAFKILFDEIERIEAVGDPSHASEQRTVA